MQIFNCNPLTFNFQDKEIAIISLGQIFVHSEVHMYVFSYVQGKFLATKIEGVRVFLNFEDFEKVSKCWSFFKFFSKMSGAQKLLSFIVKYDV